MKATTESEAPTQSAADRLARTREETAALHAEQQRLEEDLTAALVAGRDTQAIKERRARIADRLGDIASETRGLERLVHVDERKQLLHNIDGAWKRRDEVQAELKDVKEKLRATHESLKILARREFDLSNLSGGGLSSATAALQRHREAHPDVQEDTFLSEGAV